MSTSDPSATPKRTKVRAGFKDADQRILDCLKADPSRPNADIAKEVGCSHGAVAARRKSGGFSAPTHKRRGVDPDRLNYNKAARALLIKDPGRSNIDIAKEVGCAPHTVARTRARLYKENLTQPPNDSP